MKRYKLTAVDAIGRPARIADDVIAFESEDGYFRIIKRMGEIQIITPKASYVLKRHTQLNIYQGTCGGHKVHVSLKKIVGELRYW